MRVDLGHLTEADCPQCGYGFDIFLDDVRCQVTRICPVCKTHLALRDGDGSVAGAEAEINEALASLFDGLDITLEL